MLKVEAQFWVGSGAFSSLIIPVFVFVIVFVFVEGQFLVLLLNSLIIPVFVIVFV